MVVVYCSEVQSKLGLLNVLGCSEVGWCIALGCNNVVSFNVVVE